MSKARYVEVGGEPISAPPYIARGASFQGYVLAADPKAMGATLDRYLNAPRGADLDARYVPLVASCVLIAADLPELRSGDPEEAKRGTIHEGDIAFWIPYALLRREGPVDFVEELGFFVTYLFVDDGWAMSAGREVFGLQKLLARNTMPRADGDPGLVAVDTQVIERYAPESRAVERRVVEARRVDGGPRGPRAPIWATGMEAILGIYKLLVGEAGRVVLPGLGLVVEVVECLLRSQSRILSFKQFRDAVDGTSACYQSIVEIANTSSHFRGAGVLEGDYVVTIADYASHPILRDLGVKPEQKALAAPWIACDFEMAGLKTVWKAGA